MDFSALAHTNPKSSLEGTAAAPAAALAEHQPSPSASTISAASTQARKAQASVGACDACRLRKVRCLANESSMSSKCQRCTRANRDCVYTTHSKTRRRKRTDTRVKELEEKVRGLSMLLEHKTGNSNKSSSERDIVESTEMGNEIGSQSPVEYSIGKTRATVAEELSPEPQSPSFEDAESAAQALSQSKSASFGMGEVSPSEPLSIHPDVIERGILSMATATELYNRYVSDLLPLYPAVVFPPDCTASSLRERRPILFLAVIAASAGASKPALNLRLNKEIHQVYATRVTMQGRKSIEICQAMLISILWTYPPDKFEDLKFHQQITQAATMALDLGLAQKPRPSTSQPFSYSMWNPEDQNTPSGPNGASQPVLFPENRVSDTATPESRRTLLACYVFCASVTMSLRLPNMLRFSSWMTECIEYLETSEDAAPTDKRFVAWVKMQRIVEECGSALALDDLSEKNVTLADQRVQAILNGCERQLDTWRRSSTNVMNSFLDMTYHASNIYLHEIALHPDHDAEDFRPPFFMPVKLPSTQSQTVLTPPYINAILQCTTSAGSLITTFLNMSAQEILQCPTLVYPRVVYATVILIRLSISAAIPSSELGKILGPANNKVEMYLEELLIKLKTVSTFENGDKHVIASKFLGILMKLKLWSQHQKQQKSRARFSDESKRENGKTKILGASIRSDVTSNAVSSANDESSYRPSYAEPSSQYDTSTSLYEPALSDEGRFYADVGQGSMVAPMAQNSTQYMPSTTWPTSYPSTSGYSEPSNMSFNYPMDADPNLFTHLVNAELDQNYEDNWMPDAEFVPTMDYSDLPDFNWATWPQQ